MAHTLAFYLLAGLAIASALSVVLAKRPTYGVLALVVTMFALSGLFVLLKAYFIAIIQILIYAGAILVLFLFILMLIGMEGITEPIKIKKPIFATFISFLFLGGITTILLSIKGLVGGQLTEGTIEIIGRSLFKDHLLSFELVSFILLVGVLGVVTISKRERTEES